MSHRLAQGLLVCLLSIAPLLVLATLGRPTRPQPDLGVEFPNPFWKEVSEIGSAHGLDLSAYRTVRASLGFALEDVPALTSPPASFDYLVIGDSTASWGLIEGVVEQVSGARVAVFAYESLLPNVDMVPALERVVSRSLKPGGTVVLFLSDWTLAAMPFEPQRKPFTQELVSLGDAGFHRRFGGLASHSQWFTTEDLRDHTAALEWTITARNPLADRALPRLHTSTEEGLGGAPYAPAGPGLGFFAWEGNLRVMHAPYDAKRYERARFQTGAWRWPQVRMNAAALLTLSDRLVFAVPLCDREPLAEAIRENYRQLFADGAELADIHGMRDPEEPYEFSDKTHVRNLGALKQSILLGTWLRRHRAGLRGDALGAPLRVHPESAVVHRDGFG